jgi:hypothetical protein
MIPVGQHLVLDLAQLAAQHIQPLFHDRGEMLLQPRQGLGRAAQFLAMGDGIAQLLHRAHRMAARRDQVPGIEPEDQPAGPSE